MGNLNMPRAKHIQIEELIQVEKDNMVLADSLALQHEENVQKDKEIVGLKERLSEL